MSVGDSVLNNLGGLVFGGVAEMAGNAFGRAFRKLTGALDDIKIKPEVSPRANYFSGGGSYSSGKGPAIGKFSGRDFDPANAGGLIRNLDYRNVEFTSKGVDVVKKHLSRFDYAPSNEIMVSRLEKIVSGEISLEEITDIDRRFYTHELREYVRYRRSGWETGLPADPNVASDLWNDTHTATLEDYQLHERKQPLYSEDAIKADEDWMSKW